MGGSGRIVRRGGGARRAGRAGRGRWACLHGAHVARTCLLFLRLPSQSTPHQICLSLSLSAPSRSTQQSLKTSRGKPLILHSLSRSPGLVPHPHTRNAFPASGGHAPKTRASILASASQHLLLLLGPSRQRRSFPRYSESHSTVRALSERRCTCEEHCPNVCPFSFFSLVLFSILNCFLFLTQTLSFCVLY